MYSKNFTKGKNPRILQGEVFTDKDIPPFMTMEEWNKKHGLDGKKWLQEMKNNLLAEQDMIGVDGLEEPNWKDTPFLAAEHFRTYYNSHVDPDHDWKNTTHWGPQHQSALDKAIEKKKAIDLGTIDKGITPAVQDFGPTGTGAGSILQPEPEHHGEFYEIPDKLPVVEPEMQAIIPSTTLAPGIVIPDDQNYMEQPNIKSPSDWTDTDDAIKNLDWSDNVVSKDRIPITKNESVLNKFWPVKNRRLLEMKKSMRRRINEMVDNQLGNGRMISGEPKNIKYKTGDEVQDINPDCPHRDSRGVVTKVSNGEVTYKVTNWGRHFQPGDELTKSSDQLIPLSSDEKPWYIAD